MMAITWMLATYGVAAWLGWTLWRQLRTGRASVPWAVPRMPTIQRSEQPIRFWMTIVGQALFALVIAFFALTLTLATLSPNSN